MKMRKTIYSKIDIDVTYKNTFQLIRAWFISLKFIVMRKSMRLTLNGKDFGAINVVMFPKFKFIRAGE